MKYSMADYLAVAAPRLSPALVSPEAFQQIRAVAASLPPCSGSGFECRLGEQAALADFLVHVHGKDGTRTAFAGRNPDLMPPASLLEHVAWQRVREFCIHWSTAEHPLHACIEDFWLELDLATPLQGIPVPGVFFGPRQDRPDQIEIVAVAVGVLCGISGKHASLPAAVQRCYGALPPPACIYQVASMFSRGTDALRLCVRGIPKEELTAYLHGIGWNGPFAEIEALIASLSPFTSRIALALDVGHEVCPKVGLECYVDEDNFTAFKTRFTPLLDHLTERGLCRPEKRTGLLDWFGISNHRAEPAHWPRNLLKAVEGMEEGVLSTFIRYLNHVKVVYDPGRPLEAKAYPGLMHRWGRVRSRDSSRVR